jgi:hypothetical protein
MIADAPLPVEAGGDYLDGKIYFVSGSHLCSYAIPQSGSESSVKRK